MVQSNTSGAWWCYTCKWLIIDLRSEGQWFEAHPLSLCCLLRQETLHVLIVSLSTQVFKMHTGDIIICYWGLPCNELASHPVGVAILLIRYVMLQKPG